MNDFSLIDVNVKTLLERNQYHLKYYQQNEIMNILDSNAFKHAQTRNALLDYLQIFSNAFQKMLDQRFKHTQEPALFEIAKKHLDEEIDHHIMLQKDRESTYLPKDDIIEKNAQWFINIMTNSHDAIKHIVMHLVLEAGADTFFNKAHSAFLPYIDMEYLAFHAEEDEQHAAIGLGLLESLDLNGIDNVVSTYEEAWHRLNIICHRIAEKALEVTYRPVPQQHTELSLGLALPA